MSATHLACRSLFRRRLDGGVYGAPAGVRGRHGGSSESGSFETLTVNVLCRRRLEGGVYGAPAEFAADMGLIWANARTYNAPGSDVWHMAGTLQVRAPP